MRFDVFSLFPEVFEPYIQTSILQRARRNGLVSVHLHNLRDWTINRHRTTDDMPYGGGGGMVMKPEPIFAAVEAVLGKTPAVTAVLGTSEAVSETATENALACPLILMTPQGRVFTQAVAAELAQYPRLGLLCGRYEGVDERVRRHLVTDEISIGDYVLSGGELPALVLMDAITRLIPGALGDPTGAEDDSHASGLIEYPHYTRPIEFHGWSVPEVLLSGDHERIVQWRRRQSLLRTLQRRPDMLEKAQLSEAEREWLENNLNPTEPL
jgi:tRNA (guanine37-N1)-methyltransferase